MNGHDLGRLASRLLAVLLALRAIATLPGVVSVLRSSGVPASGPFLADVLASTLLPLALAVLFWWGASGVANRLLAPGVTPGVSGGGSALEATVFRAVGLYLTVVGGTGILFWTATLLAHPSGALVITPALEALAEFGLGLAILRWAPRLAQWLGTPRG